VIRLDSLAEVRMTPDGPAFNRFSLQILRLAATPDGTAFYNTATKTHATTIPNVVVINTSSTRIYQDPSDPPTLVRCASDNGRQPARHIGEPIDDLCVICPNYAGACIATTPMLIVSREALGWRVMRIDLTGENAGLARAWAQRCFVDWNLERVADLSIGLDAQGTVELKLGDPHRISVRHEQELLELWKLLMHMPLHAVTLKPVQP